MRSLNDHLDELCGTHSKFLNKGGLSVALIVTRLAKSEGLPLVADTLRTQGGGQVRNMGKSAVQKILADHGITRVLAEEAGRTSRGTISLMEAYVALLNELEKETALDLDLVEAWWIEKVHAHFAKKGPKFKFDHALSLRSNIDGLLSQARLLQASGNGATYVGAMLQHLVGAKLDLVLGQGTVEHHGANVADGPTSRPGDFLIDKVSIHVTMAPSEALIRKCQMNLDNGLKPVIITLSERLELADGLLINAGLERRVDVLDVLQFLTANIYEHSLFKISASREVLAKLLIRYNELVQMYETDPGLLVDMGVK